MTTAFSSNQYTSQTSVLRSGGPATLKGLFFEGVTATADTGTINLIKLPPGKIRILPKLCGFFASNMAATANVAIGYAAYTASNGAAVSASTGALVAANLVNNHTAIANWNTGFLLPANGGLDIDSLTGVVITATITTANTAVNGTYSGLVAYIG